MGQKPEGGAHPVRKEHEHHPNKTSMHNAQACLHGACLCQAAASGYCSYTESVLSHIKASHFGGIIPLKTASKPTPKPLHLTAEKM